MPRQALTLLMLLAAPLCAAAPSAPFGRYFLAAGMGDYVPQWLGGLPADAPPRPGTAKYDEWMKERERQRLEPAPATNATNGSSPSTPSTSSPAAPAH